MKMETADYKDTMRELRMVADEVRGVSETAVRNVVLKQKLFKARRMDLRLKY